MKKKAISIILSLSLCLSMMACGQSKDADSKAGTVSETKAKTEENATEESEGQELSAEKNLLSVEVTIPASLLDGSENTELTEEAKSHGVKDITQNEDGSVTMKMSKAAHKELLDSIKASIDETINNLLADKENYPSFDSITYNDDVTVFDVNVDSATYSGLQAFSALAFYITGNLYQALNAVPEDELKTVVNFVNKDTGEVIESGDSASLAASASETE